MENKQNNKGIIALLILIIVTLSVVCVLFATGTISLKNKEYNITNNNSNNESKNDTTNNNSNNESRNDINDKLAYKLGDVVKLSKIKIDSDISDDDYTEWYVLEQKEGYTKLYSRNIWGGKNSLNEIGLTTVNVYNRLREFGYNVIQVRQLNEEELELFSCNIDYKKLSNTITTRDNNELTEYEYSHISLQNNEVNCTNLPKFIYENTTAPYTDVQLFGYTLSLGKNMSLHIHTDNALVGFLHPVIILPTSEIG